eukprot:c5372_g1_i1.p1 GENE.c5372_g1_i1~~c5372_g1_i1.p1  ORF type:complete len:324 (-),score=66.67 c5372_g1_i1:197-1060(-)
MMESLTGIEQAAYESERHYLNDDILNRFLIATKLNVPDACKRLVEHAQWRQGFGVQALLDEDFSEFEQRKEMYWGGHDNLGQPSLIFRFRKHDVKQDHTLYVRELVYILEKGRKVLRFNKINIFLDVGGATRAQFSIDLVKVLVSTLQQNYPERVFRMYIYPVSTLERMIVNIVTKFMDPVTVKKMRLLTSSEYLKKLAEDFAPDQLETTDGGNVESFPPIQIKPKSARQVKKHKEKMDIRKQVKEAFAEFRSKKGRDPNDQEIVSICRPLFERAKSLESKATKSKS